MRRRDFLKKFSVGAGLTSVTAMAAAGATRGKDMYESTKEDVLQRLDNMEKRIDRMDTSYRKTMKTVLVVAGLSVGMDVSMLI